MAIIQEPKELDILVGKETRCRTHKGSLYFRSFVESYRQRYEDAKEKQARTMISKEMYDVITQASCRFLKFNEAANGWQEINETASLDKITHALRYAQQRQRRKHGGSKHNMGKRNVPQRSNSDTSRRSEGSSTSGTSFSSQATSYTANSLDLDVLMAQEQKRLSAINISGMNASLRAYRQSYSRPSYPSAADNSINLNNSISSSGSSKRVSFAGSNNSVSSCGQSFCATSATASMSSVESIPLPIDLSSTQHSDMNRRASALPQAEKKVDHPPSMPVRPMEDTTNNTDNDNYELDIMDDNNNNNDTMTMVDAAATSSSFHVSCHSIKEETSSTSSCEAENTIHKRNGAASLCPDDEEDDMKGLGTEEGPFSDHQDEDSVSGMLNSLYLQEPEHTTTNIQPCSGLLQDPHEQESSVMQDFQATAGTTMTDDFINTQHVALGLLPSTQMIPTCHDPQDGRGTCPSDLMIQQIASAPASSCCPQDDMMIIDSVHNHDNEDDDDDDDDDATLLEADFRLPGILFEADSSSDKMRATSQEHHHKVEEDGANTNPLTAAAPKTVNSLNLVSGEASAVANGTADAPEQVPATECDYARGLMQEPIADWD